MKPYEIDYVIAAVLVGVELDAGGDASKFPAQGCRDLIEQTHRTGEWPRRAVSLRPSMPIPNFI
jgi:hypothetical protein